MLAKSLKMPQSESIVTADSAQETLVKSVMHLKNVKPSLCHNLCCGKCKHKRLQAVKKLNDRFAKQMDVRRIISNSIAF